MAITPVIPLNANGTTTGRTPSRGSTSTGRSRTPSPGSSTGGVAGSTSPSFTPTPQYAAPTPIDQRGYGFDDMVKIAQMPADQRTNFAASGLDPTTWAGLGPEGQRVATQWGGNLPFAGGFVNQQRQQYANDQTANQFRNQQVDTFGNFQQSQMDSLQAQYNQGLAMATGRADFNEDVLRQGLSTDLGLLGEGRFRNVDLARQNVGIDQNYLNTMRGVTQNIFGIQGQQHRGEQQYINDMIGQLNDRKQTAFQKYGVNDAYAAQQAVDNNRQLGFNARGYEQDIQSAFANRGIQQRGAVSDAAARGAFGSAGFGDNIQDIYGQYDQARQAATLGLDQANQQVDERDRAIGNARDNLGLDYRGQETAFREQQLGYDRAHMNNNTGYQIQGEQTRGTMAGYDKQGAELANVSKGLDSLAREYGIKEKDLRNGFTNAVTKLGLDLADTQTQLEQMLSSGNAQLIQQGMNFMSQMMAYQ